MWNINWKLSVKIINHLLSIKQLFLSRQEFVIKQSKHSVEATTTFADSMALVDDHSKSTFMFFNNIVDVLVVYKMIRPFLINWFSRYNNILLFWICSERLDFFYKFLYNTIEMNNYAGWDDIMEIASGKDYRCTISMQMN